MPSAPATSSFSKTLADFKVELLELHEELVGTIRDLLAGLELRPSQHARDVEAVTAVLRNMVHLTRLMRPHQAYATLARTLEIVSREGWVDCLLVCVGLEWEGREGGLAWGGESLGGWTGLGDWTGLGGWTGSGVGAQQRECHRPLAPPPQLWRIQLVGHRGLKVCAVMRAAADQLHIDRAHPNAPPLPPHNTRDCKGNRAS